MKSNTHSIMTIAVLYSFTVLGGSEKQSAFLTHCNTSNMTVSLCIRQESKRNDDSVSVEELDWSAESS